MRLSERARQFTFVREAQKTIGQNRGLRVEAIQHWSKGAQGDSWCAELTTMVLDLHFRGVAPIDRMTSCQDIYEMSLAQHWVIDAPELDALFLYVNAEGHAHHIGIVSGIDPLMGIAGNTSKDGLSTNGDGCYEHEILPPAEGTIVYVRVPGVEQ